MTITTKTIDLERGESFLVSNKDEHLLYFPLRRAVFRISEQAADIFCNANCYNLEYIAIVERINEILAGKEKYKIEPIPGIDLENNVLGLALTTACTLRCSYCHADAGSNKFISDDLIDDSIDYVFEFCKKHRQGFYLVFTGSGEPTAHWKGLTRAIERARRLCKSENLDLHVSMATNGVYGDEKREYIIKNFSRSTISLDGQKEIHDKNRVRIDGSGSFDAAFTTAKYFYKYQFPFMIRTTVSKQAAPYMLENYEFFKQEFPGITVAFEPLNPIGRGLYSEEAPPNEDEFAKGYVAVLDKYGTGGVSNSAFPSLTKLRDRFCTPVARPNMNVSVDGIIHSCARCGASAEFAFGRYDNETRTFLFDKKAIERLSNISVDSFPECTECFARFHCAGDCHDLRAAGFLRCQTTTMLVWKELQQTLESGEMKCESTNICD